MTNEIWAALAALLVLEYGGGRLLGRYPFERADAHGCVLVIRGPGTEAMYWAGMLSALLTGVFVSLLNRLTSR